MPIEVPRRSRPPASGANAPDVLLQLIELVYASVGEPSLWPDFLSAFADATGGVSAVFFQQYDREPRAALQMWSRVDPSFIASFERHYGAINPWMHNRPGLHVQGVVATSYAMCPPAALRRSECLHDWMVPQGVAHALGAIVLKQGSLSSIITSLRSPRAGEPTAEDIRLVRRLLPHLRRGAQLHLRLLDLETGRAATAAALEHLSVGVVLVDGRGEVLLENRVARAILRAEDGLTVVARRLRAARAIDSSTLDGLIARAAGTSTAPRAEAGRSAGGTLAIPRPSRRRPLALLVAPLHFGQYRVGRQSAAAAVFVSDPERRAESNEEVLQRLYGLTPAEAELTALLVAGKSLDEVAEVRSIAIGTARGQLKSVFAKTGARRQSELVSVLLTGIGQVVVAP